MTNGDKKQNSEEKVLNPSFSLTKEVSNLSQKLKIILLPISIILIGISIALIPVGTTFVIYDIFNDFQSFDSSTMQWDEGSQYYPNSSLRLEIGIVDVNLNNKTLDIQIYLRKRQFVNETMKIDNDYLQVVTIPISLTGQNWDFEFQNFTDIEIESYISGQSKFSPFELYTLRFYFSGLKDLNMTDHSQIYMKIWCIDENWKFNELAGKLEDEGSFDFKMVFDFHRKPQVAFQKLLLPITIFGGIIYLVFIASNPIKTGTKKEFLEKEGPLYIYPSVFRSRFETYKTEIALNRKFRIDTSKWILAFSIANILFAPLEVNIGSFYSILAVSCSVLTYGVSKYQGKQFGAYISILFGFFAVILDLSIIFQLIAL